MQFNIGDRVISTGFMDGKDLTGKTGTITSVVSQGKICGVQFDDYISGHSDGGSGKDGYCWALFATHLKHYRPK